MSTDLIGALVELEEERVLEIARARLNAGENSFSIIQDAMKAMEIIGRRFEANEYFLPELIFSGEILKKVFAIPELAQRDQEPTATAGNPIVIGTVAGDVHDIGKDIVVNMLKANGFPVVDVGVDVPAGRFVEEIRRLKPYMLGLSGLLTISYEAFKETVDAVAAAGLRNEVKIVIGGPSVDEHLKTYAGADAFCRDVMCGVALAKQWAGGRNR